MRVRPYLRRSHDREGGASIDIQRQGVERDIDRREWMLDIVEYVDDGRSAFRDDLDNRPAMRQALEDAKRKQFDVLMVYKWDRLARSQAVFHTLLADFKRANVRVVSATESDDRLVRSIMGMFAAEYSIMLSNRMIDVRRHEAQRGILVGPVPLGYDRGPNGIPVPNTRAAEVRELGELYATGGWSAARLARKFRLHSDAVREMLECPTYAGFIRCRGELFPGKHEAIWSSDLWARIQAVRELRSRRRGRVVNDQPGLLNGLMVCANCGAPLWRHSRDRYRCSTLTTMQPGPIKDLHCSGGTTYAPDIEEGIKALILQLGNIPELFDEIDEAIHQVAQAMIQPVRQVDDRSLEKLKNAFIREEISAAEFERRRLEIHARPALQPSPLAPDPRVARDLVRNLPTLVQEAASEEFGAVVRELITDVYARRRDIVAIRPTLLGSALFGPWLNLLEKGAASPPGPPD